MPEKISHIFSKKNFSCVSGNGTLLCSVQAWNKKKNQPPKEFSKIEQKKNILSKERYSCGFGNGTLHFSVEVRKIKKYSSEKNSLSLRKRNFLALIFKTLLYFLKRNLFLYFGKWNPELLIPSSKSKKILPEKIFLYFRKWKLWRKSLYFRK